MGVLSRLIEERTDLSPAESDALHEVIAEWSLIADLAMSDLVLWVPTWNDGGLVAVAQVRPTTAATTVPEDIVGMFAPRGRFPDIDSALLFGRSHGGAYPVDRGGRVIGVVARQGALRSRIAGQLEEVYARCADDLLSMLVDGAFPDPLLRDTSGDVPRVGDGLIRCSPDGRIEFASPNAVSALRRLGVVVQLEHQQLAPHVLRLAARSGPVDDAVSGVLEGRRAGSTELESRGVIVQLRALPLQRQGASAGLLVLLRDVTEIRRREQALLSKDATIREIHHRVKNNLQMVAALLRLQGRRVHSPEARVALEEAQVRVAAIAVVHEALSHGIGDVVDFDEVLDRILAILLELAPGYASGGAVPQVRRERAGLQLPSEVATPLAMCVSELVQNAIEHARASAIWVEVRDDGDTLSATVRDDGVGLAADFDWSTAGLGLQIVRTMATGELGGAFEVGPDQDGGTLARVTVPRRRS